MARVPFRVSNVAERSKHRRIHAMHFVHSNRTGQPWDQPGHDGRRTEMFTGIVTDIGQIVSLTPTAQGQLHRLRIACCYDRSTIADGASIACNGVCLTVVASGVAQGKTWFDVDAAAGTLGMTTAKGWTRG